MRSRGTYEGSGGDGGGRWASRRATQRGAYSSPSTPILALVVAGASRACGARLLASILPLARCAPRLHCEM